MVKCIRAPSTLYLKHSLFIYFKLFETCTGARDVLQTREQVYLCVWLIIFFWENSPPKKKKLIIFFFTTLNDRFYKNMTIEQPFFSIYFKIHK